ncbi:MAG: phosphatase PAP2 family protein [Phycisphaeraceae bacterium]|nr:phosphatase PAP2 family protein [Phycisphaeraceae bacterium]
MEPAERAHHSATTPDFPPISPRARLGTPSSGPGYWPVLPIAIGLCLIPLDGAVRGWVYSHRTGGDLRRELEFLQQFGAISSIVILMIAFVILDSRPREWKRARIFDWIVAACATGITGHLLKIFIGRPRPLFDDPMHILGPVGKYPVELKDGSLALIHAWDYSSGVASDLWSMPSSHALAAASLAVALTILYPRLRWLCVGLVIVVCIARVVLGAHYPSDVFVGAGIGWWVASVAMRSRWGSRLVARLVPSAAVATASAAA